MTVSKARELDNTLINGPIQLPRLLKNPSHFYTVVVFQITKYCKCPTYLLLRSYSIVLYNKPQQDSLNSSVGKRARKVRVITEKLAYELIICIPFL